MSTSRRDFVRRATAAALTALTGSSVFGQVPTILERLAQDTANAPLAMRFQGGTADECRKWQAAFAAKLRSLLGPHRPPAAWKTVVLSATDLKDHRREELVLQSEGHPDLPVYLL